jgi:hypothetical protein
VREIMAEEARLSAEHAQLAGRQESARDRMTELLAALWPVRLGDVASKTAGLSSWAEADRGSPGLRGCTTRRPRPTPLPGASSRLAANMAAQEAARARLMTARAEAEKSKDALLAEQLEFSKQLRNVRRRIVSEEEQLKEILRAIEDHDARRPPPRPSRPPGRPGSRPWPVAGRPSRPSIRRPIRPAGDRVLPARTPRSQGGGRQGSLRRRVARMARWLLFPMETATHGLRLSLAHRRGHGPRGRGRRPPGGGRVLSPGAAPACI